jgi:hypothetical protein
MQAVAAAAAGGDGAAAAGCNRHVMTRTELRGGGKASYKLQREMARSVAREANAARR